MEAATTKPLVLITGGAGFLGINLCRYLLSRGYAVRTLDIAPFDYPEHKLVEVITGDVRAHHFELVSDIGHTWHRPRPLAGSWIRIYTYAA
jgi:nucleoside-diphosphate-sugar epimerase